MVGHGVAQSVGAGTAGVLVGVDGVNLVRGDGGGLAGSLGVGIDVLGLVFGFLVRNSSPSIDTKGGFTYDDDALVNAEVRSLPEEADVEGAAGAGVADTGGDTVESELIIGSKSRGDLWEQLTCQENG